MTERVDTIPAALGATRMVKFFSLGMAGYVILCSIIQIIVAVRFLNFLRRGATRSGGLVLPKAAIILVIRGPDPFLEFNVKALIDQRYPDFMLFVVVDHIEDPAWPLIEKLRSQNPERIQASFLREPLTTCSLKCSAMAQAITDLDSSYEVVAFVDGDASVHRTWLLDLVAPLADPDVGAVTGNRWYVPGDGGLGSITRYLWNVGVVMQLWLNGFIWPGSMAFRSRDLEKMGMVKALRTSLFDGPAVVREVRRAGLKVSFAPSAMIANREQISLQDFAFWVERQTVVAGSAEKNNWAVLSLNALHVSVCVFAPVAALIIALALSDTTLLAWGVISAASYWLSMSVSVWVIELAIRRILISHGEEVRWFSWRAALIAVPSILLAHLVPLLALLRAASRDTVEWRGITYEVRGLGNARMLNYKPFGKDVNSRDSVL